MRTAIFDNERDAYCPYCGKETPQVLLDDVWLCDVCGEKIEKKEQEP